MKEPEHGKEPERVKEPEREKEPLDSSVFPFGQEVRFLEPPMGPPLRFRPRSAVGAILRTQSATGAIPKTPYGPSSSLSAAVSSGRDRQEAPKTPNSRPIKRGSEI